MMLKWLFGNKAPDGNSNNTPSPEPTSPNEFEMFSRTATLVVFDLDCLKHRIEEDVDWWAEPADEVVELHERNLLIAGLGANDWYGVRVSEAAIDTTQLFSLKFPSGRVYIGPGENITGGGDEPTGEHGGKLFTFEPGDYTVGLMRKDQEIFLSVMSSEPFSNSHSGPVTI